MSKVKMFKYIPENGNLFESCKRFMSKVKEPLNEYDVQGVVYTIKYKIGEHKVVFLVSYGTSKLNRCYKRSKKEYDDTILSKNVLHMTSEFIFIIRQTDILCSNHNKRNVILNFFNEIDPSFSCKLLTEASSIEDFINNVKTINTISISASNDLFIKEFINHNWGNDLDKPEMPEKTNVKMDFGRALNKDYLISVYKKLKQKSYISSFDITGKNEDGFVSINEESIMAKDVYDFEKDDEGYYDINDIFEKI